MSLQLARRLSLITATQMFHREGLEMFWVLWYNGSSKKATSVSEQIARVRWRKYGVWITTTILTIHGFGLRGNSARSSTRKQWFQIKKYQKSLKNPYFTRLFAFGTSMPQVQNPVTPTKCKGTAKSRPFSFGPSGGDENLPRACCILNWLKKVICMLDTIGSGACGLAKAQRESSIGSESCHSDQNCRFDCF